MAKTKKKVGSERIEREEGYLYYLGKDGYVWRVPMKRYRGMSGYRKRRVGSERIEREEGYLYYLGKDGHVWRAPMKNKRR